MKNFVQSFYTWYRNTLRNSQYRWLIIAGTLVYVLSPIDFLPDIFPAVGWIDDGILITLLVTEISQMALAYLSDRARPKPSVATGSNLDESTIDV